MYKNLFFIICSVFILSSCKSVFKSTDRLTIEQGGLSCKQVQYYNDRPIELKREITLADYKTVSGKVSIENGLHFEYIYFPQNTQAVCLDDGNDSYLVISFEDGASLIFWVNEDGTHYRIGDVNKKVLNQNDLITYGKEKYNIIRGHDAILLFQNNIKSKKSKERRIVKGIKID